MKFKQLKKVLPTISKTNCGRPAGSLSSRIFITLKDKKNRCLQCNIIDAPILEDLDVSSVNVARPGSWPAIIITLKVSISFMDEQQRIQEHNHKPIGFSALIEPSL